MSDNLLYKCALNFKKLMGYEYQIEIFPGYEKICLSFDPSDFMHLTSIEKLNDLSILEGVSSKKLLEKCLNKKITYEQLCHSEKMNDLVYKNEVTGIQYTFDDRIKSLNCLYDFFHSKMDINNISVFQWAYNEMPVNRPHNSLIKADYMFKLDFGTEYSKKSNDEKTVMFFVKSTPDGKCAGVSVFPTDLDYSDDGRRRVSQYNILSITEIRKSNGKEVSRTERYSAPKDQIDKVLQKAELQAQLRKEDQRFKKDMKALKSKRKAFINNPEREKSKIAYEKQLEVFSNQKLYSDDLLEKVLTSLKAQLENTMINLGIDTVNDKNSELLTSEIHYVEGLVKQRKNNITQAIDRGFSTDITKTKSTENFSLLSDFGSPTLTLAGANGEAIALDFAQPPRGGFPFNSIKNFFSAVAKPFKDFIEYRQMIKEMRLMKDKLGKAETESSQLRTEYNRLLSDYNKQRNEYSTEIKSMETKLEEIRSELKNVTELSDRRGALLREANRILNDNPELKSDYIRARDEHRNPPPTKHKNPEKPNRGKPKPKR